MLDKLAIGVIELLERVLKKVMTEEPDRDEIVKHEPIHEGLWLVTSFEESEYWFLKFEVSVEACDELTNGNGEDAAPYKPELAIVSAPVIVLTLEAGVDNWSERISLFRKHK